jgi:hypothetical protein
VDVGSEVGKSRSFCVDAMERIGIEGAKHRSLKREAHSVMGL